WPGQTRPLDDFADYWLARTAHAVFAGAGVSAAHLQRASEPGHVPWLAAAVLDGTARQDLLIRSAGCAASAGTVLRPGDDRRFPPRVRHRLSSRVRHQPRNLSVLRAE